MAAPLELHALHHVEASVEAAQSDVRPPQRPPYNWFVVVAVDALVPGQAELVAGLDGSGVVAVGLAFVVKLGFLAARMARRGRQWRSPQAKHCRHPTPEEAVVPSVPLSL